MKNSRLITMYDDLVNPFMFPFYLLWALIGAFGGWIFGATGLGALLGFVGFYFYAVFPRELFPWNYFGRKQNADK